MRNIFIFLMCIFMHNITFANCADLEELRETVFQKSREVVKSNGKYVGFILEENSKIICFDLVKLHNGETETSAYSLDSHICIDLKNTDNKLEGFIKVAYLDNVHTISTDIEINDDFHIIGAKTATQTHKNITKVQKLAIFYINISDLKNPNPIEASDKRRPNKFTYNILLRTPFYVFYSKPVPYFIQRKSASALGTQDFREIFGTLFGFNIQ